MKRQWEVRLLFTSRFGGGDCVTMEEPTAASFRTAKILWEGGGHTTKAACTCLSGFPLPAPLPSSSARCSLVKSALHWTRPVAVVTPLTGWCVAAALLLLVNEPVLVSPSRGSEPGSCRLNPLAFYNYPRAPIVAFPDDYTLPLSDTIGSAILKCAPPRSYFA